MKHITAWEQAKERYSSTCHSDRLKFATLALGCASVLGAGLGAAVETFDTGANNRELAGGAFSGAVIGLAAMGIVVSDVSRSEQGNA